MTIPFPFVDIGADGVAGTGRRPDAQPAGSPGEHAADAPVHQPDRPGLQQRLPDGGVRHQPPLRRPLDAADLVRLHLAGSVPRHDDGHRRARRAGAGARPTTGARTSASSATRARKPRRCGTTRSSAATRCPGEIGFSGSWKVQSGRQWGRNTAVTFPGDGTQNVRVEEVTANRAPTVSASSTSAPTRASRFGTFGKVHRHGRRVQRAEQRHGHNFATTTGRRLTSASSAFSTRASSASAFATTSSRSVTTLPARAGHERRITLGWSGAFRFVCSCARGRRPHYLSRRPRAQRCARRFRDPPRPQS